MKKNITITISIYLFFMFLIYCGIFRNYKDPLVVTDYYFNCLKNREGFLTYQISKPEFFNEDRAGKIYKKYKMNDINQIKLNLKEESNNYASIETRIIHKDNQIDYVNVELERNNKIWLIRALKEFK